MGGPWPVSRRISGRVTQFASQGTTSSSPSPLHLLRMCASSPLYWVGSVRQDSPATKGDSHVGWTVVLERAGLALWARHTGPLVLRSVEEEVHQRLRAGLHQVLREVFHPGLAQQLLVDEEVARARTTVAGEDGMGRIGHDLRGAAGLHH